MPAQFLRSGILLVLLITAGLPIAVKAQDVNWAHRMFDELSHDFGVVARGADVRYRLRIHNPFEEPVRIVDVQTTCGCSAARPSQSMLQKGEEAYVEVVMDTARFIRRKDSNVVITLETVNTHLRTEVRIPTTAYIRSDVVLTPGAVNFGNVAIGQPAEQRIAVAYAGRPDWVIREVRSGSDWITGTVTETSRADGRVNYDLLVRLSSEAPAGTHRTQMTLITDDPKTPTVPVLVEGVVEADITVSPDLVSLGVLTPGRDKTVNVVLRGRQPFSIEKVECESDRGLFRIRLPRDERPVHVLPLTITPPEEPGPVNEEFTVTIGGRPQPLSFRAYGQVAAP